MPSNHMIIRTKRGISGSRFDTRACGLKHFRFGYEDPTFVPRLVTQCRNGEAIDWGGASVQPQDYEVLFDRPGPLPGELKTMLSCCGLG